MLPFKRAFHVRLDALGVEHQWIEVPGVGHEVPGLVREMGQGFWSFYGEAVRR
jgi:hypothetical protein